MQAYVECAMCGRKLIVDTTYPVDPTEDGWEEIYLPELSVTAAMEGREYKAPVCPDCLRKQEIIAEVFNPFRKR